MENDNYLSKETLLSADYTERLNNLQKNEAKNIILTFVIKKLESVRCDIFRWLEDSRIEKKEHASFFIRLIGDDASRQWFDLAEKILTEKKPEAVSFYLDVTYGAYVSKMDFEVLSENIEKAQSLSGLAALLISREDYTNVKKRMEFFETRYNSAIAELDSEKVRNGQLGAKIKQLEKETERLKESRKSEPDNNTALMSMLEKIYDSTSVINEGIKCVNDVVENVVNDGINRLNEELAENIKKAVEEKRTAVQTIDKNERGDAEIAELKNSFAFAEPDTAEMYEQFEPDRAADEAEETDVEREQEYNDGPFSDFADTGTDADENDKEPVMEDIFPENIPEDNIIHDKPEKGAITVTGHMPEKAKISFMESFSEKLQARREMKNFFGLKSESEKTQMIIEKAMKKKYDINLLGEVKKAAGSNTVSKNFLYQLLCDDKTTDEDILKLNAF